MTIDRKKTREQLVEELVQLRRRAESTLDAFISASSLILSVEGDQIRFVKIDAAMPTYFGLDQQSMIGKTLQELAPIIARQYGVLAHRVIQTGEPIHDVDIQGKVPSRGGETVHWRISCFPVPLPDGRQGLGVIGVETTDMKRAEEALRQSNQQFQTICQGMIEGLLITDIETKRFLRVNSPLCRMLGYTEQELLQASVKDIHPPEQVPNDLARFQAAADGHVSINESRPVLRKDGTIFYADITGHRIMYEGRPCLLALFRDITERRKSRMALERERRTLQRMLQASDHERQLIAYDIHDGLAQQLAGAIMQFQVYEQFKDAKPKEAKKAYDGGLALLRQGHSESRRLISGVRPPILDESGVIAAIAHLVHDPAFQHGPTIDFRNRVTFNRLAPVLENVIYRIVQEGLTNARIHSKSKKILLSLLQRRNRLRIEIRDWGVGFNPKVLPENRFGLEGIRQRARLLGGKCTVESTAGEGTTIIVHLPIIQRETSDDQPDTPERQNRRGNGPQ